MGADLGKTYTLHQKWGADLGKMCTWHREAGAGGRGNMATGVGGKWGADLGKTCTWHKEAAEVAEVIWPPARGGSGARTRVKRELGTGRQGRRQR